MIVVWAQSRCRSTVGLWRALKRIAEVKVVVLENEKGKWAEKYRAAQGFEGDWDDVYDKSATIEEGDVHIFSGYQVSARVREMMIEAKKAGKRVWVYDEAPVEMCLGLKSWAKRMYYRFVLPRKVRKAVEAADGILCASGELGVERLKRLGWKRIVPFGYVVEGGKAGSSSSGSPTANTPYPLARTSAPSTREPHNKNKLHVLHIGLETRMRGVEVVEKVAKEFAIERTGGMMPREEMLKKLAACDVVIACGRSEPWGMRVNDAIFAGKPVVVSDGMGARMLVEKYGAGCVVPKGDARALRAALKRCAAEPEFLARLRSGAERAAREWTCEKKARELKEVLG